MSVDRQIDFRDQSARDLLIGLGKFSDTNRQGFNFDGFRRYAISKGKVIANVQYFRSGAIESCRVYSPAKAEDLSASAIPSDLVEAFITFNASENVETLGKLGYAHPHIFFVTVIGVKGLVMPLYSPHVVPIDRNELWLDGVIFDGNPEALKNDLDRCVDMLWNASGLMRTVK